MPEEAKKRVGPAEKITTANRFSALNGLHPPDPPDPPDDVPSVFPESVISPSPSPSPPRRRAVRFAAPSQLGHISSPVEHHLIKLDGTLAGKPARFLVDSGASHAYVSKAFVAAHALSTVSKDEARSVRLVVTLADGTVNSSDGFIESAPVRISSYSDKLDFAVTELSSAYDAILGIAWLRRHNPVIDWKAGTIKFVHDATSHVLRPPSSAAPSKPTTAGLNLISGKQLEKQHRAGEIEYACIVYPNTIQSTSGSALYSLDGSSSTSTSAAAEPTTAESGINLVNQRVAASQSRRSRLTDSMHEALSRGYRISAATMSRVKE